MTEQTQTRKCKHKEGWVLDEEVCIEQEDIEVKCRCNCFGCNERRTFLIDIINCREI